MVDAPTRSLPRSLGQLATTLFAAVAYLTFACAIVYFVLFLANLSPRAAVSGAGTATLGVALTTNLLLVVAFGAHHSLFARRWVKRQLQRVLSATSERSLYVLVASVLLLALVELWEPIGPELWHLRGPAAWLAHGVSAAGWGLALVASWQLGHRQLFGAPWNGSEPGPTGATEPDLVTGGLYAWCRHPIYLGTFVAIWTSPVGTPGHLLLAASLSIYTLIGMRLEEHDLDLTHGPAMVAWRRRTRTWMPRLPTSRRKARQPPGSGLEPPTSE